MSERLTATGGRTRSETRPASNPSRPGSRPLVAIVVLTGLVLVFAAGVASWMYWLQGWLPY